MNVETKEQSQQWMHTHSPNNPIKFKQTLFAFQKDNGNCLLGRQKCIVKHLKNYVGPFRTKGVECRLTVYLQCSSMDMHTRIQLLALKHRWSISTASCLAAFLPACSEQLSPVYRPEELVLQQ
jgi:hypothetical protein